MRIIVRASCWYAPTSVYRAPTASTTTEVARYAAVIMCANRYGKLGLKMTCSQLTGYAMPSRTTCPAGVCIQLFAERIQKPETIVPKATRTAEVTCSHGGTRLQPN